MLAFKQSGFLTIYLIIIYVSFQNIMNTAKQKHLGEFSRFVSDVLLLNFINIKCQWDFILGKNL